MRETKAAYARRHGVTRPTVQDWENRGWLVMDDGQVDVEQSDLILAMYRDASDGRTKRGSKALPETPPLDPDADRALLDGLGTLATDEARRLKENYLALLSKLEYETRSSALVPLDLAKRVLFDEFRAVRDAWLNWPAAYAAEIAADLGVEPDRVAEVMAAYVHKQLAAIAEPTGGFGT
jgi:hypothetical protein